MKPTTDKKVRGGSRASDAVTTLVTDEAYKHLAERMGGATPFDNIVAKDPIELVGALMKTFKGGRASFIHLSNYVLQKGGASDLGKVSEELLSHLSPHGTKAIISFMNQPDFLQGGGSIMDWIKKHMPGSKKQKQRGGSPIIPDKAFIEFYDQLSNANREKIAMFMGGKRQRGGEVAGGNLPSSAHVQGFLSPQAYNLLTSGVQGAGSVAAYDELYKNIKLQMFDVKEGGAKRKTAAKPEASKAKKASSKKPMKRKVGAGLVDDSLFPKSASIEENPLARSIGMDPQGRLATHENIDMVKLNAKVGSVADMASINTLPMSQPLNNGQGRMSFNF